MSSSPGIIGLPALLPLLESEYPEIQEHTLHTLDNCLHDSQFTGNAISVVFSQVHVVFVCLSS